jgi:cytochrome c biogenesis protein CcdA
MAPRFGASHETPCDHLRRDVLRLIGLMISIGLADSLNPTTVGPALYLATHESGTKRVGEFTLAVFAVYLLGGIAIVLGPGRWLLRVLPHPGHDVIAAAELGFGVALTGLAVVLWRGRRRLAQRADLGEPVAPRRRSAVLGAAITAAELPTAFPYFAAIATIAGSGVGVGHQLLLLTLFNLCFVAPLVVILGVLVVARRRARDALLRLRGRLRAVWPRMASGLAAVVGVAVLAIGLAGLAV